MERVWIPAERRYWEAEDLTGIAHQEKCVELLTEQELPDENENWLIVNGGGGHVQEWVKNQSCTWVSLHSWFQDRQENTLREFGNIANERGISYTEIEKNISENNESFDGALIRLPRSTAELEEWIRVILKVIKKNAPIWIYGTNDEGIKGALSRLERLGLELEIIDIGKKSRIGAVWGESWESEEKTKTNVLSIRDKEVEVPAWPGLFASGSLDKGTELLIDSLPNTLRHKMVLDMACGSGVVSATLKSMGIEKIAACDAHLLSVQATQSILGEKAVRWDFMGSSFRKSFCDVIVTNPPFHLGKKTLALIGRRWIVACHRLLKDGGRVYLVHNKHLDYLAHARDYFSEVEVISQNASFQVICLVK
jgi:16S rRNA (guanine1207-N2)-methyltransferase